MIQCRCVCGQDLDLDFDDLGQIVECPTCGTEIELPEAEYLERARKVCPLCGGRNWRKIGSRRAFRTKVPGAPIWRNDEDDDYNTAFMFSLPRECRDCDAIWVPPAPAWGVLFLMVLGAIMTLGATAEFFDLLPRQGRTKLDDSILVSGGAAGAAIVTYALHALSGRKGQAKLLKIGDAC